MKLIALFSLLLSFSVQANNYVNVNLEHNPELINKLIEPIWGEIPYTYHWKGKKGWGQDRTISGELINANLVLAKKGHPLVSITPVSEDVVDLKWDLSQVKVSGLVRVKFQYKKFGVKLSHTEHFNLTGHKIKKAQSRVNLNFVQDHMNFDIDSNKGFNFENVHISPRDGMGKTLRWIFDNVFSKDDVDRYVTNKVNEELKKWINSNELLNSIEDAVNKDLKKYQNMKVRIGDLTSDMIINLREFMIDAQRVSLQTEIDFDVTNKNVHVCAKDLVDDFLKKRKGNQKESGQVSLTHPLIEQAIINYTSFETIDDKGKLNQPLFCFGYGEFDQDGKPMGESANIDLGVGSIDFRYWVKPELAPEFHYDVDNNNLSVWMKFGVDIKGSGNPKVKVSKGPMLAEVQANFSPEYISGKGLVLKFNGLEIVSISGGSLKVRWFPLLPYVTIDVQKYQSKLEGILNKEIIKSLGNGELGVVDDIIKVSDKLKFQLLGHEMFADSHQVDFEIIAE